MRIHTRTLTEYDIRMAAIAAGTKVEKLTSHGSKTHGRAFEVLLSGSGVTGGQWGNSGTRGAASFKAATWDEWGVFLGRLFDQDPQAKATYYESGAHFHWATGDRFRDDDEYPALTPAQQHLRHKWEFSGESITGSYHLYECGCGALTRHLKKGLKFAGSDLMEF